MYFLRAVLTMSCDFERGLLKALSRLDCSVKCCYFHQTQAIWRFVAKRGLSGQYVTNETFRWNVRSLMMLPLFPETNMRRVFDELKNQLSPDDMDSHVVYSYFEEVWFGVFPVNLWCQNNASFRTNNVAESFHAALSRRILHQHPQFNTFARQIVQIIDESKVRLEEERRHPKERRRVEGTRRKIDLIVENYLRGPPLALPLKTLVKEVSKRFTKRPRSRTRSNASLTRSSTTLLKWRWKLSTNSPSRLKEFLDRAPG